MAFHAYLRDNVDTAVVECGVGGEYDSTNILVQPTVTAITSLGIDHVHVLGSTLSEIAWHKAGIFRPGVPAFTVPQPTEALSVLQDRASERETTVQVVERHPEIDRMQLGLSADFQKTNASLAAAVAATFLRSQGYSNVPAAEDLKNQALPAEFRQGLETVRWPGRCDVRREAGVVWHLDGSHTMESINAAAAWFSERIASSLSAPPSQTATPPRILIFNQQSRDAQALARALYENLQMTLQDKLGASKPFTHVVFCTNQTYTSKGFNPDLVSINASAEVVDSLGIQTGLAQAWSQMDPDADVRVVRSIEGALDVARGIAGDWEGDREVMALITGSLHLVGGALDVIESQVDK